ncbi:MAG: glycosyltransferase family 39 protein [Polyangiaceae bacterium]|nr:glycosyltransferase family 39 protein [Polyangiaceae bacterium]
MTDGGTSVKGRQWGGRRFAWLLLPVVVFLSLGAGIGSGGVWVPPELEVAEFSRRIGASVLNGEALRLGEGRDQVPTQTELRRGQLPFISIALGFRAFGLRDWAGRLPLVLWGILGVCATALLARRFAGGRVAGLSALVLATTPIYFVQAKTMLGDIVTLSITSCVMCCLAFAVFGGPGAHGGSLMRRGAWLFAGMAFLGLAILCRGLVIGVALPLLSVGVTSWMLLPRKGDLVSRVLTVAFVGVGAFACAVGVMALASSVTTAKVTLWAGMLAHAPSGPAAFDAVIQQIGHGLLPWSAFVPVAAWRLGLRRRSVFASADTRDREVLTVLVLVTLGLCFLFATLLAPWVGSFAFPAVFALAVVTGLGLDEVSASDHCSPLAGACTLGTGLLLVLDFRNYPEKVLTPFMIAGSQLPARFGQEVSTYVTYGVSPLVLLFALVLVFGRFLPAPSWLAVGLLSLSGLALSVGLYPALAAELAPKSVFARYQGLAQVGEPLGVVGSEGLAQARYSTGLNVLGFDSTTDASAWLLDVPNVRRWLVLPAGDLPMLDSEFRRRDPKREGLPVLEGKWSSVFLVSSSLQGSANQNPFAAWFTAAPPPVARPLTASLGGSLRLLGWELRDPKGKVVSWARSGHEFQFVTYYQVVDSVLEEWRAFIHLDGVKTRINADHDPLAGRYPMTLWNVGSYVTDIHTFSIDRRFPPGRYRVYLGLFSGARRMEVLTGEAEDDRVYAGELELR